MFGFFSGLSILVVVVVLGVASLGSSIAAGAFLGAPVLANLFPSLSQIAPAMTATAGVGLGNNPNGTITSDLRPKWGRLPSQPMLLGTLVGVLVAVYVGVRLDVLTNWFLAGGVVVASFVVPALSRIVAGRSAAAAGSAGSAGSARTEVPRPDGLSAPPEDLVRTLPLADADRRTLDGLLGVPAVAGAGTGGGDRGADR